MMQHGLKSGVSAQEITLVNLNKTKKLIYQAKLVLSTFC